MSPLFGKCKEGKLLPSNTGELLARSASGLCMARASSWTPSSQPNLLRFLDHSMCKRSLAMS